VVGELEEAEVDDLTNFRGGLVEVLAETTIRSRNDRYRTQVAIDV